MTCDEIYFSEIEILENQISELLKDVSLSFPKPINSKFERDKFFKKLEDGEIYYPQLTFENREYPIELIPQIEKLAKQINLDSDKYGIKKLIKEKLEYNVLQIQCFSSWGSQTSSKFAKELFGSPDDEILFQAKEFCNSFKRETVKFTRITPQRVGEELQEEVKRLTQEDLIVEITQLPNKVNISPFERLVKLNPNERFTTLDLKRLKVHEIGVHYMRYFNAKMLSDCKILQKGTANYIRTEEGLAVYTEELKGVLSKAQMYIYAGRVIAVHYAQKLDFYNLFMLLKEYGFKDSDAYTLCFRAKRNLSDTSQIGGYPRDYTYFDGYFKIKKFSKENDLKELYFGKFKLEDYETIKEFIKLKKEKIVTILE